MPALRRREVETTHRLDAMLCAAHHQLKRPVPIPVARVPVQPTTKA